MLTTILLATTMFFSQTTVPVARTTDSKADVLAAIKRFMENPGPGTDAQMINRFAEESEECLIELNSNVLTWEKREPPYKYNGGLRTAFVAGNMKSQLDSGKASDDSYSGLLAVFKVYDKLRAKDKDFTTPEIEELKAKEQRGELKAWVEEASKKK